MRYLLLAASVFVATPALGQSTTVTNLEIGSRPSTSDGTTFTAPAGELRPQPIPTSSATISNTTALDSDGALELSGLRTRVYNDLSGAGIASSALQSLGGDYIVYNGSSDGIQSPAFRVYVLGSDGRTNELIWEASNNNGGYTVGQQDSLQSGDNFWRQIVGAGFDGTSGIGSGGYINHTLAYWGDLLGGSVLGVGIGNGGCPGNCTNFSAVADHLTLNTDNGSRSYNFAATAAVPEPSTWALMLLGFGGMGVAMRSQRRGKGSLAQMA